MIFPDAAQFRLTVAHRTDSGEADFFEVTGPPAVVDLPGVVNGAFYWLVEGGHSEVNVGQPASQPRFPGPNGSGFQVASWPAQSAGKPIDYGLLGPTFGENGQGGDPAMHATDTIDYGVILSGKVDLELPGGKLRTVGPGDLIVMGGVPHTWKNRYDEDCIYAVVTIGFNKPHDC